MYAQIIEFLSEIPNIDKYEVRLIYIKNYNQYGPAKVPFLAKTR